MKLPRSRPGFFVRSQPPHRGRIGSKRLQKRELARQNDSALEFPVLPKTHRYPGIQTTVRSFSKTFAEIDLRDEAEPKLVSPKRKVWRRMAEYADGGCRPTGGKGVTQLPGAVSMQHLKRCERWRGW